jgi:hypothetical protein
MHVCNEAIYFTEKLEECPQCYCGEIRQMLTFLIDLSCPKVYQMPDHYTRLVEYHRNKLLSLN